MALIDQDATVRALVNLHEETGVKTAQAIRVVMEMPEADVQEGVRCKDCEFYTAEDKWCRRLGLCGAFEEDGYCSHAEPREESDNG